MAASVIVSQSINKMRIGNADKLALLSIFNGLLNDIETLRANQRAMGTKLDSDAGVTDTTYTSLTTTAAGGLSVTK